MTTPLELQTLNEEIAVLEEKLQNARSRLNTASNLPNGSYQAPIRAQSSDPTAEKASSLHTLLLLADSALPLGSFAFSSGLESFLAHHPRTSTSPAPQTLFHSFLGLSLQSLASSALPYVLAAFTERSFRAHHGDSAAAAAVAALDRFAAAVRAPAADAAYPPNGHLAPLWGVATRVLGVARRDALYLFLFSHARTVVSAAVRASVLGPYQAQFVLASAELRARIDGLIERHCTTAPEDAGQSVPVLDLWVGRHEMLYSRIFNS